MTGRVLVQPFEIDVYQTGFERLREAVREASERVDAQGVLVGIESTGHYHENLVRQMQNELGLKVVLINPFSTNEMRNLNLNSIKTDDIDLDAIHELLAHGKGTESNLPEGIYLELRELTRFRRTKVEERGRLKQQIHGHLDRIYPGLINPHEKHKQLFADFWDTDAAWRILRLCPSPQNIVALNVGGLQKLFHDHGFKLGPKLAGRIVLHAKGALSPRPEDSATRLKLLTYDLELLDTQDRIIGQLEQRIKELLMQTPGRFLLSIRGVAETTAAEVIAEVGPPQAYHSADAVTKLSGLYPSLYESGQHESTQNPITRFGRATLRQTAVNSAIRLIQLNPYFKQFYERLVKRGKHKKVAQCATARKFLCVCFAMMRDRAIFNPPHISNETLKENSRRPAGLAALQQAEKEMNAA
jgi:transposase